MNKKVMYACMLVCIVALLSPLMIPTVLPCRKLKCPISVEGLWTYIPQILDSRVCRNDVVLETTETCWWSGGFEGTSDDYPCRVVVHGAKFDGNGNIERFESRYYTGIVRFRGEVCGKRGRLVMVVVGKQDWPEEADVPEEWTGTWRILRGKGRLRGVEGFGTWWGPGFIPPAPGEDLVPGEIPYDGWIFFRRIWKWW